MLIYLDISRFPTYRLPTKGAILRWGILRFTEQDAAKPASELAFPSVTVCSPGLNMEAVEEALYKDFEEWKRENGRDKQQGGGRPPREQGGILS